jgi:hypothetical protein
LREVAPELIEDEMDFGPTASDAPADLGVPEVSTT